MLCSWHSQLVRCAFSSILKRPSVWISLILAGSILLIPHFYCKDVCAVAKYVCVAVTKGRAPPKTIEQMFLGTANHSS